MRKLGLVPFLGVVAVVCCSGCSSSSRGEAEIDVRRADTNAAVSGAEVVAQIGTKDGVFCGDGGTTDSGGVVKLQSVPVDRDLMISINSDGYIYLMDRVAHPDKGGMIHWTVIPEFRMRKESGESHAPPMEIRVVSPR
jgi:hypothetical protein